MQYMCVCVWVLRRVRSNGREKFSGGEKGKVS